MTLAEERALRKELKRAVRERDRLRLALHNGEQITAVTRQLASQIQDDLRRQVQEQRETAAALVLAKAAAEKANQAKSRLLGAISHELRTPMNGVLGSTQLLSAGSLSQEQAELVEVLQSSTVCLITLVDQLLDFAKLEAGAVELVARPVELSLVLGELTSLHRANAHARGLTLSLSLQGPLPRWVSLDDARLRQVLTNLIDNALRFTEEGGVTVIARQQEDGVYLAISDTGPGIPEQVLPTLFQPFQQADGHVWRRHGGSGLGLSICQRLVERMGGCLEVDSELGRGTVFHFVLPLKAAQAPAQVEPSALGSIEGRVVLVVDDNPVNRLVASRMLANLGCEVLQAEGGEQAVAMVRAGGVELVLMDCSMPGMDGYEATRRIRALSGLSARTPVLALTAMAVQQDRERCVSAGMDGFLSKPVLLPELHRTLIRFLVPSAQETED